MSDRRSYFFRGDIGELVFSVGGLNPWGVPEGACIVHNRGVDEQKRQEILRDSPMLENPEIVESSNNFRCEYFLFWEKPE